MTYQKEINMIIMTLTTKYKVSKVSHSKKFVELSDSLVSK